MGQQATGGGEIRFRIDGTERAQAEQVAAKIGMSINDVMKVMLKRFIAAGGLPFDMRVAANDHNGGERLLSVHGIPYGLLAEIASNAAKESDLGHVRAGRLSPVGGVENELNAETPTR